jgi:hypothetical protein
MLLGSQGGNRGCGTKALAFRIVQNPYGAQMRGHRRSLSETFSSVRHYIIESRKTGIAFLQHCQLWRRGVGFLLFCDLGGKK